MTANDTLYQAYSSIIRELAGKENCVFVGRCADYILERAELDHISLFIAAPFEWRVQRKMEQLSIDEKQLLRWSERKTKTGKHIMIITPAEAGADRIIMICVLIVPG